MVKGYQRMSKRAGVFWQNRRRQQHRTRLAKCRWRQFRQRERKANFRWRSRLITNDASAGAVHWTEFSLVWFFETEKMYSKKGEGKGGREGGGEGGGERWRCIHSSSFSSRVIAVTFDSKELRNQFKCTRMRLSTIEQLGLDKIPDKTVTESAISFKRETEEQNGFYI